MRLKDLKKSLFSISRFICFCSYFGLRLYDPYMSLSRGKVLFAIGGGTSSVMLSPEIIKPVQSRFSIPFFFQ